MNNVYLYKGKLYTEEEFKLLDIEVGEKCEMFVSVGEFLLADNVIDFKKAAMKRLSID